MSSLQHRIWLERAGIAGAECNLFEARAQLAGSGSRGDYDKKKYVEPHIGSKEFTHTLAKEHEDLPAGSRVKIHGVSQKTDESHKYHVHVEDEQGGHHVIPMSKLRKPGEEPKNKGHEYESSFVDRLKKHGIMPHHITGAGSSAGTDFAVENKKKKTLHAGKVEGNLLNGETKNGTTAAMGQLTVRHDPKKGGWHIPDEARKKRPLYAKHIEKSGIIDHMNKHMQPDKDHETTASGRTKTVVIKHPNLDPADAYLQDHHAHVLQVGGHGTYRVGGKDETGHGLPKVSGKGQWRIREKQTGNKNSRMVAFHPDGVKGLNKSHIDLDKDEDMEKFKKTLGH